MFQLHLIMHNFGTLRQLVPYHELELHSAYKTESIASVLLLQGVSCPNVGPPHCKICMKSLFSCQNCMLSHLLQRLFETTVKIGYHALTTGLHVLLEMSSQTELLFLHLCGLVARFCRPSKFLIVLAWHVKTGLLPAAGRLPACHLATILLSL